MTKPTMKMLDENMRTQRALNGSTMDEEKTVSNVCEEFGIPKGKPIDLILRFVFYFDRKPLAMIISRRNK